MFLRARNAHNVVCANPNLKSFGVRPEPKAECRKDQISQTSHKFRFHKTYSVHVLTFSAAQSRLLQVSLIFLSEAPGP